MEQQKYPQDEERNEYRYISPSWIDAIARGLTAGAKKHPGETWKTIPSDEHLSRAMRHINLYRMGDRDEPHIINASMRLMMAFCTVRNEEVMDALGLSYEDDDDMDGKSNKYAYIYHPDDAGYWTGFESIEEALEAARERNPGAETVYITETKEFVPSVRPENVIENLQEDIDDECAGCYEGYLDDASHEDKDTLGDMLTETFVRWAKKRGIKYWVDIPSGKDRLYDLRTGKPVEEESK